MDPEIKALLIVAVIAVVAAAYIAYEFWKEGR